MNSKFSLRDLDEKNDLGEVEKRTKEKTEQTAYIKTNKGGKFLKKLWCCVRGSITRQFGFINSYLLYSSSHPSHVKNSIPYSQLLRLRRLCSEDSDFSLKSEEMCHFFDKRGYPASVVQAGHHRAQQIDRQSALQTSQKENNNRIPFTLTTTQLNPSF